MKRLRSEGYIPTTFKPHVHDWMSAGSFWDFEGRHEGRANGRNEWVTLDCWNAEGHRPWSLILRTKEGPWATYAEGDNQLFWGGDILVEEVIGRCRRANPNAIDLTPWDFELLGEPSTELS
ncbi:MAG TPA: hypothetical protein VD907_04875 [Verrucomicrobiae bacterium]|nr:hypothetical protein [Verrucomicrobiae bacterium]